MSRSGAKLRVRQVKSGIGYNRQQKATLAALGLGKLGRVREHPDNPQVRGMAAKIPHLVVIEDAPAKRSGKARKQAAQPKDQD